MLVALSTRIARNACVCTAPCMQETLEFHVGNRVFDARPLFSQGSSAADRNKLERFFHMGGWGVASAFAPITYSPMPVLVYKRVPIEGVPMPEPSELYPAPDRVCNAAAARTRLVLVATGSVLHTDPTRLILKRIVLSGYPLSVRAGAHSVLPAPRHAFTYAFRCDATNTGCRSSAVMLWSSTCSSILQTWSTLSPSNYTPNTARWVTSRKRWARTAT